MFEVYYKLPADPKKESILLERVAELGGRLDCREEPNGKSRESICLTYEFDDLSQAAAAADCLRQQGEYVEGPQAYGEESKRSMNTTNAATSRRWTAAELLKLPPAERDAIMEAAAALAEKEYRNNSELSSCQRGGIMRQALVGTVGLLLGVTAGWWLPNAMIPRPHEFDFIAIIGWRMVLVPLGATVGLVLGLFVGKQRPPS